MWQITQPCGPRPLYFPPSRSQVVMDSCSLRPKGCRIPAKVQGVVKHLRALWETAGAAVDVAVAEDQDGKLGSSKPDKKPSLQQITPVKLALVPHAGNL